MMSHISPPASVHYVGRGNKALTDAGKHASCLFFRVFLGLLLLRDYLKKHDIDKCDPLSISLYVRENKHEEQEKKKTSRICFLIRCLQLSQ